MNACEGWVRGHAAWALGATAAAVAAAWIIGATAPAGDAGPVGLVLATILVAVLGLPHGAVDHWQGREWLRPLLGHWWLAAFGGGYVAAAGLVVFAWSTWPPVLLGGFLVLAAAHFGSEDAATLPVTRPGPARHLETALRGAMPAVLPPLLHVEATAPLFAALLPATEPAAVAGVLEGARVVLPPFIGALLVIAALGLVRDARLAGAEIVVLLLLFASVPPLPAFALYFCAWHAPRHTLAVLHDAGHRRLGPALLRFARGAAPLTALTIAIAAASWWLLRDAFGEQAALLQVVFIGLAALTVPHVLLPRLRR